MGVDYLCKKIENATCLPTVTRSGDSRTISSGIEMLLLTITRAAPFQLVFFVSFAITKSQTNKKKHCCFHLISPNVSC